jgi:hypothetical protein
VSPGSSTGAEKENRRLSAVNTGAPLRQVAANVRPQTPDIVDAGGRESVNQQE